MGYQFSYIRNNDIQIIFFLNNMGIAAAMYFLQILLKDRGITDQQIGILAIIFSVSLMISNTIFGKKSDINGTRVILLVGLLSISFTLLLYIFSTNMLTFTIARILHGISLGIYPVSIIKIASDKNMRLGNLSAWGAIGWSIGVIGVGYIAELDSLETSFIIGSIILLFTFFLALAFKTGTSISPTESKSKNDISYSKVLKSNWLIYLTTLLRHGTAYSIWVFWPLFLQEDLNLSNSQIGIVLAINPLVQSIAMKFVTDRGNPNIMFLIGTTLSSIAFFSFTLTNSFIQIALTQIILGISWALFYVGGLRSVEQKSKLDHTVGTATGLYNATLSLSAVIGPIFAIIIYHFYNNYIAEMYFASLVTISAAFLFLIIDKIK